MLHIEGTSDVQKEEDSEMDLLRQLVLVYGSTGEEVSSLRTRVDAWLEARGSDEVGPEALNKEPLTNSQAFHHAEPSS